ncbi:MAG TPA: class I SAM-dependent methyltransferase [Gaiellaceae bacterium]|nr:class I SAM-dependent methyltransferase [Gaiellaceae bacterium]
MTELGYSFGNVAETYHRVRPPYSQPLLDRAQEALELGADARVLDLAAGTGRLTRELMRRFAEVVAVEPDERMRAVHGGALAGSAEAIPLEEASVDAVFVGEAFHWFDPAAAIPEVARVLRSRGGLAVVSTHWWETEPPLPEAALEPLSKPYERSLPQRRPPWHEAFGALPFEPLRRERAEEEVTVDADQLLTLYSTTSALASLAPQERAALFAEVRPLLAGPYRLPLKHELWWTRLAR